MSPRKVAVIGAGVIGLSSAVIAIEHIQEHDVEFTLLSENFSPDTTGDGSAGFWQPYLLGDMSPDLIRNWGQKTFHFFESIYKSPQASDCGISLVSCYNIFTKPVEQPDYKDVFVNFRWMTEKELSLFPSRYKYGFVTTSYIAECKKFLPVLMKRFKNKGGKIIQKKVDSIAELSGEYDVVINCPGVEAARLVPDPLVKPIRGQVINVKAPWVHQAVIADYKHYIFPHTDKVVCGGTSQVDNWSVVVDPEDRQDIWKTCTDILPSLKKAETVSEWVGLRPSRSSVRLEKETLKTENGDLEVIHNYGHGGSGVTLSWGCAHQALSLLQEVLDRTTKTDP